MGVLDEAPVVGGDIGSHSAPLMTSMSISSRFLGDSFTAVGKPAPPRPTTTAGPDRVYEGLHIRHLRGGDGGVHRLLAVRGDDHGLLGRAVGRG